MNIIKRISQWLDGSNRRIHARWLGLAFAWFMAECLLLGIDKWSATCISLSAVVVIAIAIEAKDKQVGNQPDRLDIVASLLWPSVIIASMVVYELIYLIIS